MQSKRRDADEKILRKKSIRMRFRRLVLAAMLNLQWLDDPEDQGIVMNAKKNVAFLIRQKRKTGLLTVAEKALLRTPHALRTIEERKKLCLIVAALPCFGNLPPKLRVRLIPYLKFANYGEDRLVIRQDDIPITVYFMISGEVEMKKIIYDKNSKKTTVFSEAIVGGGDVIGDVAMLENCLRLNTYVTLTPCEVLYITDDEFKDVLGKYMKKVWQQKKTALRALNHFSFFTEAQIVRACAYCQLEQYDPLHSIYSEDRGAVSCVHFILSGECVVLQCLKMVRVMKSDGTKTFELIAVKEKDHDMFVNPTKSARSFNSSFLDEAQKRDNRAESEFNIADLLASTSDLNDEEAQQQRKAKRKTGLREIEIACGLAFPKVSAPSRKKSRSYFRRVTSKFKRSVSHILNVEDEEDDIDDLSSFTEEDYILEEFDSVQSDDSFLSPSTPTKFSKSTSLEEESSSEVEVATNVITQKMPKNVTVIADTPYDDNDGIESDDSTSSAALRASHLYDNKDVSNLPTETHFIDVGSLTYGGIFGLGERITHRVIMARTVVQCLLLPRYWLMAEEQNPGHIWMRRKFSLETNIPSREELFNNFLKTRRWEKFKRDYVQSTLNENSVNSTHPEDIPIICRIVETRDDI